MHSTCEHAYRIRYVRARARGAIEECAHDGAEAGVLGGRYSGCAMSYGFGHGGRNVGRVRGLVGREPSRHAVREEAREEGVDIGALMEGDGVGRDAPVDVEEIRELAFILCLPITVKVAVKGGVERRWVVALVKGGEVVDIDTYKEEVIVCGSQEHARVGKALREDAILP